jgi:sialic acid synthase SpsE
MAKVQLKDGKSLEDFGIPYIVAEVNSSHNGNVETACQMIKVAKEAGCDCVKFQSWSPESLYSRTFYEKNPITKRIVAKFSLNQDELLEMANYCKNIGIGFSSTPYSEAEVDFLVDRCDVPFIKIASMETNNYDFLTYIAEKGIPIVLSTGMSEIEEVKKAVEVIEAAGNGQICLLHCISIYPADSKTINLNNIPMLRDLFPNYPIGFSDHTLGTEISCAATALGTALIEKHLTLDKTKMGMDNNMAIEPNEMKALVDNCHNVQLAMGCRERVVREDEYAQRLKMRRSVIALKDLDAGTTLSKDMLGAKRPGDGISPDQIPHLVGKKLKNAVASDCIINKEDIEY